jgi:succinoglycan biosynthesis protein ExoM
MGWGMTHNKIAARYVIGCISYKRPESLSRLLKSIEEIDAPAPLNIIIVDNEGEGGAATITVQKIQAGYKFPIRTVSEPKRGVSEARNALFKEVFEGEQADFLAMLDDDTTVDKNWLTSLIKMQVETQSHIVGGRIIPHFDGYDNQNKVPLWTADISVFHRKVQPDGIVAMIYSTNNTLIAREVYIDDKYNRRLFNIDFSLSGGEDAEFFYRLSQDKAKNFAFAYTKDAVVIEHIPASRQTKKWAYQRSFRIGAADIRILKLHHKKALKLYLMQISTIVLAMSYAMVGLILCFWHPRQRVTAISRIARQFGKIASFMGYYGQEYKVTHGK